MLAPAKASRDLLMVREAAERLAAKHYPNLHTDRQGLTRMCQTLISSADHLCLVGDDGVVGAMSLPYDVFERWFVVIKLIEARDPWAMVRLLTAVRTWAASRRKVRNVIFVRDYPMAAREARVLHELFCRAGYDLVGGTYQVRF